MSNVIAFPETKPREAAKYFVTSALIEADAQLLQGDLVACCWLRKDGTYGDVMFWQWWGPTGRDGKGRFVKKGSPLECCEVGGMPFLLRDLGKGSFRILGKVLWGNSPVEWTPGL